ncbi:MAG: hypothetical protein IT279_06305 [Ignavibacteriaceae bacterium]|nr:hypothetical protein [Ignavibacteriaceae bacterium]
MSPEERRNFYLQQQVDELEYQLREIERKRNSYKNGFLWFLFCLLTFDFFN